MKGESKAILLWFRHGRYGEDYTYEKKSGKGVQKQEYIINPRLLLQIRYIIHQQISADII